MKTALQCILFVSLAGVAAFAASAQQSTEPTVAADAESAKASQEQTGDAPGKDEIVDRFCLRDTGSRIVAIQNARSDRTEKRCVNAPGRVYTSEDIASTGVIDLAEALRMLDPSIP